MISKHATNTHITNNVVRKQTMEKHSHHWQALLEKIPDYLLEGEGKWWTRHHNGDVEFLDIKLPNPENHPALYHFRSADSKTIRTHLAGTVKQCIDDDITLPVTTLHHYDLQKERDASITHILNESEQVESSSNGEILVSITMNDTDVIDSEERVTEPTSAKDYLETQCSQPTFQSPSQSAAETEHAIDVVPVTVSMPPNRTPKTHHKNDDVELKTPRRKIKKIVTPSSLPLTPPGTPLEKHKCLTKLGATLSKLFGNSYKDVMALDRAKHATKQRPSSVTLRTKFKELESRASTRVLQLYTYCNQQVSEWEKKIIMEHSVFPTKCDIHATPCIISNVI